MIIFAIILIVLGGLFASTPIMELLKGKLRSGVWLITDGKIKTAEVINRGLIRMGKITCEYEVDGNVLQSSCEFPMVKEGQNDQSINIPLTLEAFNQKYPVDGIIDLYYDESNPKTINVYPINLVNTTKGLIFGLIFIIVGVLILQNFLN